MSRRTNAEDVCLLGKYGAFARKFDLDRLKKRTEGVSAFGCLWQNSGPGLVDYVTTNHIGVMHHSELLADVNY